MPKKKTPEAAPPASPPTEEPWISCKEASLLLGMGETGLWQRLYFGDTTIPHQRRGRAYVFQKSALDAWQRTNPPPLPRDPPPHRKRTGLPSPRRKQATEKENSA